jgi:REP element-mobilizing transposase RayT
VPREFHARLSKHFAWTHNNLSVPLKLKTIAILKVKAHIYFMSRNASTDELYFASLTVVDWIDVFTRWEYSDFIIENLKYCQQHKNLNIYAYVIMTNHIHLLANVTDGSLGEVLGRFKSYTSKKLFEMIANNPTESRREWMIKAFEHAGKYNPCCRKGFSAAAARVSLVARRTGSHQAIARWTNNLKAISLNKVSPKTALLKYSRNYKYNRQEEL